MFHILYLIITWYLIGGCASCLLVVCLDLLNRTLDYFSIDTYKCLLIIFALSWIAILIQIIMWIEDFIKINTNDYE